MARQKLFRRFKDAFEAGSLLRTLYGLSTKKFLDKPLNKKFFFQSSLLLITCIYKYT